MLITQQSEQTPMRPYYGTVEWKEPVSKAASEKMARRVQRANEAAKGRLTEVGSPEESEMPFKC